MDIDLAKNVFALHGVNEPGKAESIRPAVASSRGHSALHRWPHINANGALRLTPPADGLRDLLPWRHKPRRKLVATPPAAGSRIAGP
ncbi:hypothetical protein ACG04R_26135 [Roseateles sp. BYS78W]|uniref:Uncharacterized protein n=1 Tax=Pelomonas candidula TaxID=3299025 RepID=A0ABW7HJT0_9BURK